MLVCGIDIGTTSICVFLASAATGETAALSVKPNAADLESPHAWERLQDPELIVDTVLQLINECGGEWDRVQAIGISSQMHGIVYIDASGNSVSPLYTWQDGRGELQRGDGSTYAQSLSGTWGRPVWTGYGMVTHDYNVLNSLVPPEAVSFCTIGDYMAIKLCGAITPLIDPSNAAAIGLFNVASRSFDVEAMRRAGLDPSLLPPVVDGHAIVGTTPDGKPVVSAIGDNQASFLGTVKNLSNSLLVNVGTGAQVSAYMERWLEVAGLETRPFPGGGYLLVGSSLSGGKSYALLAEFFRDVCRSFGSALPPEGNSLYERMNELAERALESGMGSLRINTQFYGTRQKPSETAAIRGLSAYQLTPGYLAAGVLHGIVDELAGYVRLMPDDLRKRLTTITGAGNGIRRNHVLQRIVSDSLHTPLHVSDTAEEAAFGAAIYAAVRTGLFSSLSAAIAGMRGGR